MKSTHTTKLNISMTVFVLATCFLPESFAGSETTQNRKVQFNIAYEHHSHPVPHVVTNKILRESDVTLVEAFDLTISGEAANRHVRDQIKNLISPNTGHMRYLSDALFRNQLSEESAFQLMEKFVIFPERVRSQIRSCIEVGKPVLFETNFDDPSDGVHSAALNWNAANALYEAKIDEIFSGQWTEDSTEMALDILVLYSQKIESFAV